LIGLLLLAFVSVKATSFEAVADLEEVLDASVHHNKKVLQLLKSTVEDQTGDYYHSSFNRLAYLVDTWGPRLWGSETLELVIKELEAEI